ncbi:MAG: hypothetical protein LM580_08315 [Thermofilum sp.]|nr:hypothetical protein [Thermofilum sp.]
MVEAVALPVLGEVLRQVSERIAKKLMEGKKLTDTEVIILLLDQMNRRIDAMNESLGKRIEDVRVTLDKRIDDMRSELSKRIDDTNDRMESVYQDLKGDIRLLYQEVSSVKSVVIDLLRKKLEEQ